MNTPTPHTMESLHQRQRVVFADRYEANPDLSAYLDKDAREGVDPADLPEYHPDSFKHPPMR